MSQVVLFHRNSFLFLTQIYAVFLRNRQLFNVLRNLVFVSPDLKTTTVLYALILQHTATAINVCRLSPFDHGPL